MIGSAARLRGTVLELVNGAGSRSIADEWFERTVIATAANGYVDFTAAPRQRPMNPDTAIRILEQGASSSFTTVEPLLEGSH